MTEEEKKEIINKLIEEYNQYKKQDEEFEAEFKKKLAELENIAEDSRKMQYEFDDFVEQLSDEFDDWQIFKGMLEENGLTYRELNSFGYWLPSEYSCW